MGFFDLMDKFIEGVGNVVSNIIPTNDPPSCVNCINCKARIKQLPSGKQIRVFTCPYTGEYDEYQRILPSVNPVDVATLQTYKDKYIENIDFVDGLIGNCVEQPGGTAPLRNEDYRPFTRYKDLKYCPKIYECNSYKPRLYIDNSNSSYPTPNEMLYQTNFEEVYFDNLSEEDKKLLMDMK